MLVRLDNGKYFVHMRSSYVEKSKLVIESNEICSDMYCEALSKNALSVSTVQTLQMIVSSKIVLNIFNN